MKRSATLGVELQDGDYCISESGSLLSQLRVHPGVGDVLDAFHRRLIGPELGHYFSNPFTVPGNMVGLSSHDDCPHGEQLADGFRLVVVFLSNTGRAAIGTAGLVHDRSGTAVFGWMR